MRAIEIGDSFGLDELREVERPEPPVIDGAIKVRVIAASLNYRDFLMVTGKYNPRQPLPLVPCSDAVGEVVEVGEGVESFAVGDRVCTTFFRDWVAGEPTHERLKSSVGGPLDGTLQECLVVPEHAAVHAPAHLSDDEASTLTCAAVTAWNALVTHGRVAPGETVLVQGTGGVSTFALQIGVALGARVLVTSSSHEKLKRAREMGAWETINYVEDEQWGKTARALTDRGVDHVVEVGGAGTLEQSLRAVRPGGQISLIGVLAGGKQSLNVVPILMRQIRVQGVIVGDRESFLAMNRAFQHHELHPLVDRTFPLDETRAAFDYLQSQRHMGKVVVRVS